MKVFFPKAATVLCAGLAMCSAQAVQVVADTNPFASKAGASVIDFNNFDGQVTSGPLNLSAGVVFTSTPFTTVGAAEQDLGQNGLWGARGTPVDGLIDTPTGNGNFLASAFVVNSGVVGFNFAAPVAHVGAFFNQFQRTPTTSNNLQLIAYDADGSVLESFNFRIDTDALGYNEGKFLGISRASADIYGFGVADGTFVMDNLTMAPVPEPETYALWLAGLGVMGWVMRNRRRV